MTDPAVADNGDTSGGLQDTGSGTGGCRDQSKGQTYARAGTVDGKTVVMYTWYVKLFWIACALGLQRLKGTCQRTSLLTVTLLEAIAVSDFQGLFPTVPDPVSWESDN